MDDAVQLGAVGADLGRVAEDALAERRSIEGSSLPLVLLLLFSFRGGGKEEIGGRGAKVLDDLAVAGGAWLDDFAREEVGVDDGEIVGRRGEDGRDGGFTGGEAASQAND